ncbi:MAG TPA: hypothetical protein VME46_01565 [Acidimicrobiales bacterium]|nr:hypothetical protein [Acidimicrobiales bacterium]
MSPDSGFTGAALVDSQGEVSGAAAGPGHRSPPPETIGAAPSGGPQGLAALRLPPRRQRLDAVTLAHVATLIGALCFWVYEDRHLWFFGDEWDFLVVRGVLHGLTSSHGIFYPHNEHWSTLPILAWRALFNVFHLGSYWPYLLPVLVAHVAIMHLVWRVCLRTGAAPWVATAAVGLLGVLGAGAEDLAWAFQLGFVGSVLFGLLAIDLLDRPAAPHRGHREQAATAAVVAALMCSTLGDAMVVGTAIVAFARLPWRRACVVIGPPVALYALWFAVVGHLGLAEHSDRFPLASFTGIPAYVWTGLSSALGEAFNLEAAGAAILVGLVAWLGWHMRPLWADNPALVAVTASAVAFYALAAVGRDASTVSPTVSRYIYVAIVLMLPLIARVLSSLGSRPAAQVAVAGLLAFCALGNVSQAQVWTGARAKLTSTVKTQLAATGRLLAAGVTDVSGPSAAPVSYSPNLSVARIARLGRDRELPEVSLTPLEMVDARAVLALGAWNGLTYTLTRGPLFASRFRLSKTVLAAASAEHAGCRLFKPQTADQAMRVWLAPAAGAATPGASVRVAAAPAAPGTTDYAAVFLVPRRPPAASVPVELAVPADGTGYLNDNYLGARIEIVWDEGTPLMLCGLARSA